MLLFLKYSLTRWLSVEKKSARDVENLMALVCFMRERLGEKEVKAMAGVGQLINRILKVERITQ
jgi:hypothetical protein